MGLKQIDHGSAEYKKMVELRKEILRKPLGLDFSEADLENEKHDTLIAAFDDDEMVGCCMLCKETDEKKIEMLKSIKGIGKENADSFVKNIHLFMEFIKECNLEGKLQQKDVISNSMRSADITDTKEPKEPKEPKELIEIDKTNPLYGKKIVMSKIRDKEIIEFLHTKGAELDDNIRKDTFVLIIKSKEDVSNKTKYAREHNIPILTPSEFKDKYM
jgi:hypothetical protein